MSSAEQQAARQFSEAEMREAKIIFVKRFLAVRNSAEILEKEALDRRHAKTQKTQALREALWDGSHELRDEARRCLREAINRGQLLFAFDGTTVLEGGAA